MKNLDAHGFTLIEIVITIVVVSIIGGLGALIVIQGMRSYSAEDARSDVLYQARFTTERMAREARLIRDASATNIPTMTATDLSFCDVTGKAVEFQVSGTTVRRQESATCSPLAWGGWNTLASSIDPAPANTSFSYFQNDGITTTIDPTQVWFVAIRITAKQGSEALTVQTRVHPMNF